MMSQVSIGEGNIGLSLKLSDTNHFVRYKQRYIHTSGDQQWSQEPAPPKKKAKQILVCESYLPASVAYFYIENEPLQARQGIVEAREQLGGGTFHEGLLDK